MNYEKVLYSLQDGVARISMNDPATRNAGSAQMGEELVDAQPAAFGAVECRQHDDAEGLAVRARHREDLLHHRASVVTLAPSDVARRQRLGDRPVRPYQRPVGRALLRDEIQQCAAKAGLALDVRHHLAGLADVVGGPRVCP